MIGHHALQEMDSRYIKGFIGSASLLVNGRGKLYSERRVIEGVEDTYGEKGYNVAL